MSGEVECGRSLVPAACTLGARAQAVRMHEFRAVLHEGFLAADANATRKSTDGHYRPFVRQASGVLSP